MTHSITGKQLAMLTNRDAFERIVLEALRLGFDDQAKAIWIDAGFKLSWTGLLELVSNLMSDLPSHVSRRAELLTLAQTLPMAPHSGHEIVRFVFDPNHTDDAWKRHVGSLIPVALSSESKNILTQILTNHSKDVKSHQDYHENRSLYYKMPEAFRWISDKDLSELGHNYPWPIAVISNRLHELCEEHQTTLQNTPVTHALNRFTVWRDVFDSRLGETVTSNSLIMKQCRTRVLIEFLSTCFLDRNDVGTTFDRSHADSKVASAILALSHLTPSDLNFVLDPALHPETRWGAIDLFLDASSFLERAPLESVFGLNIHQNKLRRARFILDSLQTTIFPLLSSTLNDTPPEGWSWSTYPSVRPIVERCVLMPNDTPQTAIKRMAL
jgi:hypothetical protein